MKSDTVKPENKPETLHRSVASGLDAQIYLSNTYSSANNICPLCSSVLGKELVNIPVTEVNGDFYRYYADEVKFCYKCRKAYISKDTISSILNRMNSGARTTRTVKLENATVYRNENNTDYLYSPTLSNSHAVYFPGNDYRKNGASQNASMELNAQSFLGEMGYSVNKEGNIRRHILIEAVKTFGKRRVTDHIAFLIATRKAQENGAIKYAHAIRIWQEDINYITEI